MPKKTTINCARLWADDTGKIRFTAEQLSTEVVKRSNQIHKLINTTCFDVVDMTTKSGMNVAVYFDGSFNFNKDLEGMLATYLTGRAEPIIGNILFIRNDKHANGYLKTSLSDLPMNFDPNELVAKYGIMRNAA